MKTVWGDIDVCDAHVHFFSHGFFAAMARQKADFSLTAEDDPAERVARVLNWAPPPAVPEALAEIWVKELDRHGILRAALIASIPGDEMSVAAAVAQFPGRFYGYFMVNPLAPEALDRVEAALNAGLRGICFFPAMHRYSMNDPHVEPILQAASARTGVVIFVHCGVLTVGIRRKLGLASPFDMRYSNPIDLHPLALLHPKLNFVVPHFGAGYLREALMLCDLCPNVCLDTSSSNGWMRYHAPLLDLRTVFARALEVAGPSRLLFGSDSSFFPRGWHAQVFADQAQALQELGTSAADARAIFGDNLVRLLCQA
jgi:predicted TIM-barrel fold metal-dependent hydrolase